MESWLLGNKYVLLIGIGILLYYLFEWQRSKTILYSLMRQAKRFAKDMILKSGKEQEDWVVQKAMAFLPYSVKVFTNENVLRAIVHELYHALKDYVDDEDFG